MKQEVWNDLLLMRRQYSHLLEKVSYSWGLTRAEMDVLLFLANNPTLDRAADVVEVRGLTKSHVSIAVKALCDRGFLETHQDASDRRVIHLKPTAAATDVIAAGQEAQCAHIKRIFSCFTPEEMQQWLHLQKKLFASMKNIADD